jgi:threonine dehydrogenase-like Zn-dependent dehydrogenase
VNAVVVEQPGKVGVEQVDRWMAVLHSFEWARDLLVGGAIGAEAMITHRMALDSYEDAIAAFPAGAGLKIQVTPTATGQAT